VLIMVTALIMARSVNVAKTQERCEHWSSSIQHDINIIDIILHHHYGK